MAWDPREDGADCDRCPLSDMREGDPVPAEINKNALFMVIGDYPGTDEVEAGRPYVGDAGKTLDAAMAAVGVYRQSYSLTNTLSCHAPGNKMEKVMKELAKRNKEIEGANKIRKLRKLPLLETWKSPFEACRPRLLIDLKRYKNWFATGKNAAQAVLQEECSITDVRGGPVETEEGIKILPTFNPAYVNRRPSERFAFEADVGRAVRWFKTGKLGWIPPKMIYRPGVAELHEWWFKARGARLTFDIETLPHPDRLHLGTRRRYDALYDLLGVIGFWSRKAGYGVVMPFRSRVDPLLKFYTDGEQHEVDQIIFEIFQDKMTQKAGWNSGYYDTIPLERYFWRQLGNSQPKVLA